MWSPQRYIEKGIAQGYPEALVRAAAARIDAFAEVSDELPPILTLGHLGKRANLPYQRLRQLVDSSRANEYDFFRIRKRSGGHRLISVPKPDLMWLQRWISLNVLRPLKPHRASFAFAPGSSIIKCAQAHCHARWLIKLDVSGFFGSVSEIQVYRVFKQAGYDPMVAFQLARLTTHAPHHSKRYIRNNWISRLARAPWLFRQHRIGFLPQGAPSSPMLSNLVMREIDTALHALALAAGLTYTRYSDDITFSTTGDYDRARAKHLITAARRILAADGFEINPGKTRVVPPGGRKLVLGLLVDGEKPALTRAFRDMLRFHLHYLAKLGPEAHAARRGFDSVSGVHRHVLGLINFAKSVDETFAAKARARFDAVAWKL